MRDTAGLISEWVKSKVEEAGCVGAVFGLSGGLDSAVVAALCRQGLGTRCLALVMPVRRGSQDEADALQVARQVGIRSMVIYLDPVLAALKAQLVPLTPKSPERRARIARANLAPRVRMILLYYHANLLNYLVIGTGNRSELEVGYFTKHGDGGADILPLGGLVKSQVRDLAARIGILPRIIEKPPSAGLWKGQTDEQELGLSYEQLDSYLLGRLKATEGDEVRVVQRIEEKRARNRHKLVPPPVWRPEP
jgi:NAD+ synthase